MRRSIEVYLCLAIAALAGCKQNANSISGQVTYNGTPVENGYISFGPVGSGRSIAAPIVNGEFSIAEVAPGKYTAVASGTRRINHYSSSAEANANAKKFAGHASEAADYIAPDAEGNSQQVEITSGDQKLDFAITGPPMPQ